MRVAVASSQGAHDAAEVALEVAAGATVLEALRASGLLDHFARLDISSQSVGIWGRVCGLDTVLTEGDRVEVYRPLEVEPKEARRRREQRRRGRTGTP